MDNMILQQEEKLFKEWMKHEAWIEQMGWPGLSDAPIEDVFNRDGLHFTGEPVSFVSNNHTFCDMTPGNQELLWNNAFLKPVFLTKDYYGKDGDSYQNMDIRKESGSKDNCFLHSFYKRYLVLLYGLTNYCPDTNTFPTFEEASCQANYWTGDKGYYHAPVVRMNIKKISGGDECADSMLNLFIAKDKDLLTRQKDIYKGANVFVCCHGGGYDPANHVNENPIMALLDEWFHLKPYKQSRFKDRFVWYSETNRVIVLHEWHMSYPISCERYYGAVAELKEFLDSNREFLKPQAKSLFTPI